MKKRIWLLICGVLLLCLLLAFLLPLFGQDAKEHDPYPIRETVAFPFDEWRNDGSFGVSATCAVLMEAQSGSVLFSQNPDLPHGMASTTKIMTALVVLEVLDPASTVEICPEMTGVEGSSIYLQAGEHLTVEELLYGLLLESGNDAAMALALSADESAEKFAERMNRKALQMGLSQTHFVNPHGLSAEGHYTTARELALITREAMQSELFCKIVSTHKKDIPYQDVPSGRHLVNHNPLLTKYQGTVGVKTGWTTEDGKCFVSASQKDGMTLIGVTLGDENISATHLSLLEYGFENYTCVNTEKEISASLPVVGGTEEFVSVHSDETLRLCLPKGDTVEARLELPAFLYAGTPKGTAVGKVTFYYKEQKIGSVALYTAEELPVRKRTLWEKLFGIRKKKDT